MIREHSLPSLRDIVAPGPVERGLYLIDKAPDTATRLLDRIVDLLWWDSVAMPGVMTSRVAAWMNDGRPSARSHRRQSRIGALHWIDTGGLFNAEALQNQSRLRGLDGARVARSIRLQAPVSGEQYLSALERVPNAALCALGENERPSAPTAFGRGATARGADVRPPSSVWWTPLVVISDLFSPLTDRALPYVDRAEVVERILERLRHLRERAVVIGFLGATTASDRLVSQEILRLGTRVVADHRDVTHTPTVPLRVPAEALH